MTLCLFKFWIAFLALWGSWYFTIAVVKVLPKLSCSMWHFSRAPSVAKSFWGHPMRTYKSSFWNSGLSPITFKVRKIFSPSSFFSTAGLGLSCRFSWKSFLGLFGFATLRLVSKRFLINLCFSGSESLCLLSPRFWLSAGRPLLTNFLVLSF